MKILQLRFKNLNSLYGEWFIDFTTSEYVASGIFAITGPTGAGKSTILDALCLALYGQTPRLGKISLGGNEIMSRQTGECFAEVTFEAQGQSYRCHWSQHRAYRKADGKLANSKHEIADAVSGQLLESKKRNVSTVIEEKTGMDFDRFTRSILLAQGGFAAFLQASSDERAPILEQITGTEIYSDISKKVHERRREEQEKLKLLQAESAGITLLSKEQERELLLTLEQQEDFQKNKLNEQQEITKAISWLTGIDTLRLELATLDQEISKVTTQISAFKGERERLQRGQKAAELSGEYATLYSLRNQQKEEQFSLSENEKQIPEKVLLLKDKEQQLTKAMLSITTAKEAQKAAGPLLKKVRALDLQLVEKKKLVQVAASECQELAKQLAKGKEERARLETQRQELRVGLQGLCQYLDAHQADESLVEQFAGIAEQLKSLELLLSERFKKNEVVRQQQKKLAAAVKLHESRQKLSVNKKNQHLAIQKGVSQEKGTLTSLLAGRLLREYRAEYDSLMREMVFLRKISDLETERSRLEDGTSCPLCGATEHPWAKGNVPEIDQAENKIAALSVFIQKAEQCENHIKELEQKENDAHQQLNGTEQQLAQALYQKEEADRDLKRLSEELSEVEGRLIKLQQTVLLKLQAYFQPSGIESISVEDIGPLMSSLSTRRQKWQECQEKKIEIEKRANILDAEIKEQDGAFAIFSSSEKEKQQSLTGKKKECESIETERRQLFQSKSPDEEETRLEKVILAAEDVEKLARESRDLTKQQLLNIQTKISSLKETLVKRKELLETSEKEFAEQCQKAGFKDEATFIACRLTPAEIQQIGKRAQEIDGAYADLLFRKKDRESRLAEELKQRLSKASLLELRIAAEELAALLKEKAEKIGALKQRLADDKVAKIKIRERLSLLEAQKTELARWENLHLMIGSGDGKKYRNFAQGITFELMVSHANRQLTKLTDRYLLLRDDQKPLELNVIDNYQAGEVRSTKNLSGGESFMVSLALALGLSKMASRKVRVDSLFLDEGFGTLDEESLETALETLSGLQQDGKIIGVISHVPGLKERISTQIEISPLSGGKSSVRGPGCSKL